MQKKPGGTQNNKQGQGKGRVSEAGCRTPLLGPVTAQSLVVLKASSQGTRWNTVLLGRRDAAPGRRGKGAVCSLCCLSAKHLATDVFSFPPPHHNHQT